MYYVSTQGFDERAINVHYFIIIKPACVDVRHPPSKPPANILLWACRSQGKSLRKQTFGQSSHHEWLASRKIWGDDELETLPAGKKPKTSQHRLSGGERCVKRRHELGDLPWKEEKEPSSIRLNWTSSKGNVRRVSKLVFYAQSTGTVISGR